MQADKQEMYFKDWKSREETAEAMLPLIGRLYRNHGIVTTLYGRGLVNKSTIDILKAHRFARQILENELSVRDTCPVLQAMCRLDLGPARVDIGKLTVRWQAQGTGENLDDFVRRELSAINTGKDSLLSEPKDIVLYGFGRIGRLLARILIEKTGGGDKLRLRAAVVRKGGPDDLLKRASLLRRDSVHGSFQGVMTVDEEENAIVVNGNMIRIIYSDAPETVDYTAYGIHDAILIDNTGTWRDRDGLGR
ncbi:MAG: glyceraldehyde-3-phosphate dehydrogenase, partial [Afipia sp.]|nr:glyceraldehyde-3-phosphate dehydrogenase [Afipia sp.]